MAESAGDDQARQVRALIRAGRFDDALHAADALRAREGLSERVFRLAGAAAICGERQRAAGEFLARIEHLEPALAISILREWARTCAETRQVQKALALARSALEAAPSDADAGLDFARYSLMLGRAGDAESALARVVAARPDDAAVHEQLSRLYFQTGEAGRARHHALKALELDRDSLVALRTLGDLRDADLEAGLLSELADREPDVAADDIARIHRGFALGSLYEARGNAAGAFGRYRAANRAQALRAERFDLGRDARELDAAADALAGLVGKVAAVDPVGESPAVIFVVGVPRSGTTLVEQVLAAHPDVVAAGERSDVPAFAIRLASTAPGPGRAGHELRRFAERYRATVPDPQRVSVDKQPLNYRLLALIARAFPDARIVRMHRDPHDVALSNFASPIRPEMTFATSMDGICDEIERFVASCEGRTPDGLAVLDLGYEDLVREPRPALGRLLDFCGLSPHDGCERFFDHRRPVHTISAVQVRQPLTDRAVGRWRPFAPFLEPWLPRLAALRDRDLASRQPGDRPTPPGTSPPGC
ncbi:MAG: sulfotransferase [Candidatus Wenzhouxiangella sp. M2_3B_020]